MTGQPEQAGGEGLRGDVGVFGPREFRGWAFMPSAPDEHLRVQVKIGDSILGEGVASQFRGDLADAGIGRGDHAFSILIRDLAEGESLGSAVVAVEVKKIWLVLALAPAASETRPAPPQPPYDGRLGASPLFIVGSPRSGTSALVVGVRACGYQGYNEGNFLGLIEPINHAIWTHFAAFKTREERVMMSRIDERRLREAIFAMIKRTVDGLNPQSPWLDKTGNHSMILSLPMICKLWPDCRIIFAKRRGIENVISRLKKFKERDFEYHCIDWAKNMSAWRSIRTRLDPAIWLEVDQQEMATKPFELAAEMGKLLAIPPEMRKRMALAFVHERPQETKPGTARGTSDIDETGWSAEQIKIFHACCDTEMKAYGYSYDKHYWAADAEVGPATAAAP